MEQIEELETRLLAWGVVDKGFSESELRNQLKTFVTTSDGVDEHGISYDDEIYQLVHEAKLFHQSDNEGPTRIYRSRMAETIRLLVHLRQLFPQHQGEDQWKSAARLVAEYRFARPPRLLPERNIDIEDVIREVTAKNFSEVSQDAMRALGANTRLAEFQSRSTKNVLNILTQDKESGVIITAGTGTGKSLAFYLPALSHIASRIDNTRWTKLVAIYPRNELIHDQLAAVLKDTGRLDTILRTHQRRPITVGVWNGSTPRDAGAYDDNWPLDGWERLAKGWRCTFIKCPNCDSDMYWPKEDIDTGTERLRCDGANDACQGQLDESQIVLTRNRMQKEPPDVLLTTTESLNNQLPNTWSRHVFVGQHKGTPTPCLALLDEAHLYSGTTGAQVGRIFRRWRHATNNEVPVIGLSATLTEAASFFSQLTGIEETGVEEITPHIDDMQPTGHEYHLALKADPMSGASVLSTTIQTIMLLRRVLDPPNVKDKSWFGKQVFAFADSLDIANRLFHSLLDAEGLKLDRYNRPYVKDTGSLASLRRRQTSKESRERYQAGQVWEFVEALGHNLQPAARLNISRTSSQDRGLNTDSDVVVATSTLEVGIDAPDVGAIVQHKCPREPADLVQRRGRAGRSPDMRPWSVITLSDYNRDRFAYQAYDRTLFSPLIPPKRLPLTNRAILRMQATLAFLDWASYHNTWKVGLKPKNADIRGLARAIPKKDRDQKEKLLCVVESVLKASGQEFEDFKNHLEKALGIDKSEVIALLWDPPRSLMQAALPTLRRNLSTSLRDDLKEGGDRRARDRDPLPTFIPSASFNDLVLEEVNVELQEPSTPNQDNIKSMPLKLMLRHLAPGNVTRRFAVTRGSKQRHWIPIRAEDPSIDIREHYPDVRPIGTFGYTPTDEKQTSQISCLQPLVVRLEQPDEAIRDSSTGRPIWNHEIIRTSGSRYSYDLAQHPSWAKCIERVEFFLHEKACPLKVRRFYVETEADISTRHNDRGAKTVAFVDGETQKPVALGFEQKVDGLVIKTYAQDFFPESLSAEHLRSFRSAYFHNLVETDSDLDEHTNYFQRGRLAEVYLCTLLQTALARNISIEDAQRHLSTGPLEEQLQQALGYLYGSGNLHHDDLDPLDPDASETRELLDTLPDIDDPDHDKSPSGGRPFEELQAVIANPKIQHRLAELATVLWEQPSSEWNAWANRSFRETLGAAFVDAARRIIPDLDTDDLIVDLSDTGPIGEDKSHDIWITEQTIGGAGAIELIHNKYRKDSDHFYSVLHAALHPADFEQVHTELQRVVKLLTADDEALSDACERFRQASELQHSTEAFNTLKDLFNSRGVHLTLPVTQGLFQRLLQSGTASNTDQAFRQLLEQWDHHEQKHGIELDRTALAYALNHTKAPDAPSPEINMPEAKTFNFAINYMWPRGWAAYGQHLQMYHPYYTSNRPPADRALVLGTLVSTEPATIDLADPDWMARLQTELVKTGEAVLLAPVNERLLVREAINRLLVNKLDYGRTVGLTYYPILDSIRRDQDHYRLHYKIAHWIGPGEDNSNHQLSGTSREIYDWDKHNVASNRELRDIIKTMFIGELLVPSKRLWIVSPWISDIPIIDNRAGNISDLLPTADASEITLATVIHHLLTLKSEVVVITRTNMPTNRTFLNRLGLLARGQSGLKTEMRKEIHEKGICGDTFHISGSLNFTTNAMDVGEEHVRVETADEKTAKTRIHLLEQYPHYA